MTLIDDATAVTQTPTPATSKPPVNVPEHERVLSVAVGVIALAKGISRLSVPGLILAGLGFGLIRRGVTGFCPLYKHLEIDKSNR